MARKSVNVSQAIRDFLNNSANAGMKPKDAAAEISKQIGKKVSPTYVSNIKTSLNGSTTSPKAKKMATSASPVISPSNVNLTSALKGQIKEGEIKLKKQQRALALLEKTEQRLAKILA